MKRVTKCFESMVGMLREGLSRPRGKLVARLWAFYEEERYDEALMLIEQQRTFLSNEKQAYFEVQLILGFIHMTYGKCEKASACFQEAAELLPEDPRGWFSLSLSLNEEGRYEESLAYLLKTADLTPNLMDIHYYLGMCYFNMERWERGVSELLQHLEESPGDHETHRYLGIMYYELRDYREAELRLRNSIEQDPACWESHYYLGCTLYKQGKFESAIKHLRAALQNEKRETNTWYDLGRCLEKVPGGIAEAEECYRKCIQLTPNYLLAFARLARIQASRGFLDDAEDIYKQMISLSPSDSPEMAAINHASSYFEYGRFILIYRQDKSSSLKSFQSALYWDSKCAEAHYCCGKLLLESGHRSAGMRHLSTAAGLGVKDASSLLEEHGIEE